MESGLEPGSSRLQPGDVFLTRGRGLLSWLIRFFTRTFGESRTMVNHVGIVVEEGAPGSAVVIEALNRVRRRTLMKGYGPPRRDLVAVYRPVNLTREETALVVAAAEAQEGLSYGYVSLVAHLMDWCLMGVYLFRRILNRPDYPICSYLVSRAFAAAGKDFGVRTGEAEPDDIWDFVWEHTEAYEEILPLAPMIWHLENVTGTTQD